MKLSIFFAILCAAFDVNCAVAPRRWPSHISGLHAKHPVTSKVVHHKHASGARHNGSLENGTYDPMPRCDLTSIEYYTNSTMSTQVAPLRPQNTATVSHRGPKRSLSLVRSHHHSGIKASTFAYGEVDPAKHGFSGSGTVHVKGSSTTKIRRRTPTKVHTLNLAPTPAPTTSGSHGTTVFINNENDFALLLPNHSGEYISDAEADGVAFCTAGGCSKMLQKGFITAAAVTSSPDNTSWIQVTGCIDPTKTSLAPSDDGGQFDVRFPNGAQCSFGGYGASFIEQVEPSANRFCLRCCAKANDQTNCNSHQDRAGCAIAIPGIYDFPEKGVSCA